MFIDFEVIKFSKINSSKLLDFLDFLSEILKENKKYLECFLQISFCHTPRARIGRIDKYALDGEVIPEKLVANFLRIVS